MDTQIRNRNVPTMLSDGRWTCPDGWMYPSCPICKHEYPKLKPEKPEHWRGTVDGPVCRDCDEEEEGEEE